MEFFDLHQGTNLSPEIQRLIKNTSQIHMPNFQIQMMRENLRRLQKIMERDQST